MVAQIEEDYRLAMFDAKLLLYKTATTKKGENYLVAWQLIALSFLLLCRQMPMASERDFINAIKENKVTTEFRTIICVLHK